MNKKPYLLTVASYTQGSEKFLASLRNTEGTIDYLSVEFEPPFYEKPLYSARLFLRGKYPGHLHRLEYVPFSFFDPDRWVIFCDTDDVIVQRPIPELPDKKDILVSNESVDHKDGFWFTVIKQFPVFTPLLDKPVYNAGLFAMKAHVLEEYVQFLKDFRAKHKLTEPQYLDQLILNYWLHEEAPKKWKVGYVPTLFCPLYANYEKGYCQKVNGTWCNKKGEPYTFVHANGPAELKRML